MKGRLLVLLSVFALSISWLALLVHLAPASESDNVHLRFPSTLADLKELSEILIEYLEHAKVYVLILFISAYLFKQAFAVPGSVFMNVLGGAVFGPVAGFALCCLLTAIGATICYFLAKFCGQEVALRYFPDRIQKFKIKLRDNEGRLFYFLLFLRLFPVSPNWAINMSCGVLDVPVFKFFVSVLIGLMPYNYVCVQTGSLLASVGSMQDMFTWTNLLQLTLLAFVALIPTLWMRNDSKKRDKAADTMS